MIVGVTDDLVGRLYHTQLGPQSVRLEVLEYVEGWLLQPRYDSVFFYLGPTSSQASLLSEIRWTFDTNVSLLTLYDNSTLGKLTIVVENTCGSGEKCDTIRHEQAI